MHKILGVLLCGMVAMLGTASRADDVKDGEQLYRTKTCIACHGARGQKPIQTYPALAGQNGKYLLEQLRDIKSGKRVASADPATGHPFTEGMAAVMHLLNDEDLPKLASYLAAQKPGKPKPVDPAPTAEEIAAGEAAYKKFGCQTCHGKAGADAKNPVYPAIAGLHRDYLMRQMTDMREGVRTNGRSKLMLPFIKRAGDEDVAAIAAYLSQIERGAE